MQRGEGPRKATFLLFVLALLTALDELDSVAFGVLLPEIRDAYGLTTTDTTLIFSAQSTLLLLLALPIGYLGDRVNRVTLIRVGAATWATATLAIGWPLPIALLVMLRLMSGAGKVGNVDVHTSLLADHFDKSALPRAISVHRLASVVGALASGPLVGWLFSLSGDWRRVFWVIAIPSFLGVLATFPLREPVDRQVRPLAFAETVRRLKQIPTMRYLWGAAFLLGAGLVPFGVIRSLFFQDVFGFSVIERGRLSSFASVCAALGFIMGAALVSAERAKDERSLLGIVVATGSLYAAGIAALGLAPSASLAIVAVGFASASIAALTPPYLSLVSRLTPVRVRTSAFAVVSAHIGFGGVILSQVSIRAGAIRGQRFSLLMIAGFVFAGALVARRASVSVRADARSAETGQEVTPVESAVLLEIRDVSVRVEGVEVLSRVNLQVQAGECVAVRGHNGAGKSTLLGALSGSADIARGTVAVDGTEVTYSDEGTLAGGGVASLPYGPGEVLDQLTVEENLAIASRQDPEAVHEAVSAWPELSRLLKANARTLSGGERRMLGLAMLELRNPRLALIDELTLGLADPVKERARELVQRLVEAGTAVLFVEQGDSSFDLAPRTIVLRQGTVTFDGPTEQLAVEQKEASELSAMANETQPNAALLLQLRDLKHSFGGVTALDGISMDLRRGEFVGLTGPNGAGKSTLLNVISGSLRPDSGEITFRGVDVTHETLHQRARRGMARCLQAPMMWDRLTVEECVTLCRQRRSGFAFGRARLARFQEPAQLSERDVGAVVELCGLGRFAERLFADLSTGERRLVQIAGAIASQAELLLLDEPTAGLSDEKVEQVRMILELIKADGGQAVLIIEHDQNFLASLVHRRQEMRNGRISHD